MIITRTSPFTRKTRTLDVNVTEDQVRAYNDGALVQDAFPHLTSSEREFIMTGITEEEWAGTFNQTPDPEAYRNSEFVEGWN